MDCVDLVGSLRSQGIHDARVLRAVAEIPRERFVPKDLAGAAWEDRPLPIGYGQTISQPFIVAFMLQALCLQGDERVLDVGTGSGYQAALLSRLCREVFSVEIVPELAERAQAVLSDLGVANVRVRVGDGWHGWPEEAPFGGIVSASSAPRVREPLQEQLRPGARMVLPVGPRDDQHLVLVRRVGDGVTETLESLCVRFVPMTGLALKS